MKRKLICIGLCVSSLSLLIGGCADDAMPTESPPAIEEAAETSQPETVEELSIEPAESPKPSASPKPRPSVSASPTPSATQANNIDVNNNSGGSSTTSQSSGGSNTNQAPAESEPPSTTPTPASTPDPNAGKTWYDDVYEDVWVVDEPARVVEEVITETREWRAPQSLNQFQS